MKIQHHLCDINVQNTYPERCSEGQIQTAQDSTKYLGSKLQKLLGNFSFVMGYFIKFEWCLWS